MELKGASAGAAERRFQRQAPLVLAERGKEKGSCCLTTAGGGFPAGKACGFPAGCCHVLYFRILSNDK